MSQDKYITATFEQIRKLAWGARQLDDMKQVRRVLGEIEAVARHQSVIPIPKEVTDFLPKDEIAED